MADLIINSSEESIIDSLNFKLPTTSRYVTDRRQVRFYPSGASDFTPTGVRTARILLSGDGGWIDPSSLRIGFTIQNTHATQKLYLAGGPHVLIERIRIFCAGTLVEDLGPHYGRMHEMFMNRLMPQNHNMNAAIVNNMMVHNQAHYGPTMNLSSRPIAPGYSATVLMPIACGFLKTHKYLPVRYAPVQIEVTFGNAEDAIVRHVSQHVEGEAAVDKSTSYTMRQLTVFCAQARLDSALESNFAQILLSNRALTVPVRTVATQVQTIPDGSTSFQISLVRPLSRMNAVFVTFTWQEAPPAEGGGGGFGNFYNQSSVMMGNPSAIVGGFGDGDTNHYERNLTMQLQIGSKMTPETEASSMGEFFDNLQQAIDTYDQSLRTVAIAPQTYSHNFAASFIAGFNLCRVPGHFASGINTRTGDLLVIKCKNLKPGLSQIKVYVNILYEGILEVRESGCSFYD